MADVFVARAVAQGRRAVDESESGAMVQLDKAAIEESIAAYCDAGVNRIRRGVARILERIWADDATYTDPTVHTSGIDELLAHMANSNDVPGGASSAPAPSTRITAWRASIGA